MNEININLRQEQLRNLKEYVKDIDKDLTLILQSLQWDRKYLQQGKPMVTCKYDPNHRILVDRVKQHEEKCYLKSQHYLPEDLFLPEPLNVKSTTLVKLSTENINDIINYALKTDPSFKRSSKSGAYDQSPLTLGRLQATFSSDERRALHDAVAAVAPPTAPLNPLDGNHATEDPAASERMASRNNALLALRDARRRRARHRRAAPGGYKQELRELITAQMESITGKLNDGEADDKLDITTDNPYDGRRGEYEDYRRDLGREYKESKEDKRKEYERGKREDEKRECKRGDKKDNRRDYEKDSRDEKRREYDKESRDIKRKQYEHDKKSKERNKFYEYDDRRRRRNNDTEYSEIKQEKDDYPAGKRKRQERYYDKDRNRERDTSSFRDKNKYHRQEKRHHGHKSTDRQRNPSCDREYNRSYNRDIDSSYLKIKKEPPDD